jgi:hypothetical protein
MDYSRIYCPFRRPIDNGGPPHTERPSRNSMRRRHAFGLRRRQTGLRHFTSTGGDVNALQGESREAEGFATEGDGRSCVARIVGCDRDWWHEPACRPQQTVRFTSASASIVAIALA